jgi:PST family polysaccharide transporter
MHADPARIASAYLKATSAIALISAPLMLGLFSLREPFVESILGRQWMPMTSVLAWLAPVGFLQSVMFTGGTIFQSTGRTDIMFRWGIFSCSTIIVAFLVGIHWGLRGLLIGYTTITLGLFFPSLIIPLRLVGLKISKVFLNVVPSVVSAVVMALVVSFSYEISNDFTNFPKIRLSLLIAIGVLSYGILSCFFQWELLLNVFQTLRSKK